MNQTLRHKKQKLKQAIKENSDHTEQISGSQAAFIYLNFATWLIVLPFQLKKTKKRMLNL